MSKYVAVVVAIVLVAAGVLAYWRLPWLALAARAHAQRGSLNCGQLADFRSNTIAPEAAIRCALNAQQHHRPFTITFHVHGIDEQVSNAIIGDSAGNAIELFYGTGTVERRDTLLKHRCVQPTQLQIDPPTIYGIPRLHCTPWPPSALERDYIFW